MFQLQPTAMLGIISIRLLLFFFLECGFVKKGLIYYDNVEAEELVIVILFHDIISE